ncbi:MAG: hypothetical protein JRH11_25685 [Deltaproteobacteria bacterium]|nr:hypothetical protein [Deltaproteobacteria bacterium]
MDADLDSGSIDASPTSDADVRDAGLDASADGGTSVDAGLDARLDAGLDASLDAGTDAGTDGGTSVDAGAPGPIACDSDMHCPSGSCVVGRCFTLVETTETGIGLNGVDLIIAGADADGTLRLVTAIGDDTYEVLGRPGAWLATPGRSRINGSDYLKTGRQGTTRTHHSFLSGVGLDRAVTVDQSFRFGERESRGLAHAFRSTGELSITTMRRVATGGVTTRYPLHLWSLGPSGWEFEEVARSTSRSSSLLPRFAGSNVEIIQTDGFFVYRWSLEPSGWNRTVLRTFTEAHVNGWPVPRMNDASGVTHLVLALGSTGAGTLVYVQVGAGGVDREVVLHSGSGIPEPIATAMDLDDEGNVYVLTRGPIIGTRRASRLYRIAPDGSVDSSTLASLRADTTRLEYQALSAREDGTLHVYTYANDLPTVVESSYQFFGDAPARAVGEGRGRSVRRPKR